MRREKSWELDPAIEEAIMEGARAGLFRRAARLCPEEAGVWQPLAEEHSARARRLLARRASDRS